MNQWFKIALYSLVGIVLASFILGTLAPNNGVNFSFSLNRPGVFFEGDYNNAGGWNMMQYGANRMQNGMHFDRRQTQNYGY